MLFNVLRNGKEVIESINYFLDTQTYPRDKYDIAAAATQLSEEDLTTLLQMPVSIVVPDKEYCTKVYAIQQVMERYSPHEYDMIVIFNSDNRVVPNALHLLNNAYYSGCDSIQAHRMTETLRPVQLFYLLQEKKSIIIYSVKDIQNWDSHPHCLVQVWHLTLKCSIELLLLLKALT